jgi:hypothetical protein
VKPELKIDWASHEAAKFCCENWHYSKVLPVGKLVKVGAWENNKFIGVVLFGRGANHNMSKPYGLGQDECVELVRVALNKHTTPVSKIMMLAIKFLKKSNAGIKLIVSYADLDAGHHGGIYQATNWIYEGIFNAGNRQGFLIKGRVRHNKSVHSMGVKQNIDSVRRQIDPNAQEVFTKGKHKYLMPLNDEMSAKIAPLAKPYPKRVKKQDSEHPSELGGAVPTDTLHHSQQGGQDGQT